MYQEMFILGHRSLKLFSVDVMALFSPQSQFFLWMSMYTLYICQIGVIEHHWYMSATITCTYLIFFTVVGGFHRILFCHRMVMFTVLLPRPWTLCSHLTRFLGVAPKSVVTSQCLPRCSSPPITLKYFLVAAFNLSFLPPSLQLLG